MFAESVIDGTWYQDGALPRCSSVVVHIHKYREASQDCACGRQMTPTHMKEIYELQHGFPKKKRVNVFNEIDEFFTKEVDARAQGNPAY